MDSDGPLRRHPRRRTVVGPAIGGVELERFGSFETGFFESDDNAIAWPVPNVIGVVRRSGLSDSASVSDSDSDSDPPL